jgi:alpha-beta hydrolase superfamily lysophospholipase
MSRSHVSLAARLALRLLLPFAAFSLSGCGPAAECQIDDDAPLGALTDWEQALVEGDAGPTNPEAAFLTAEDGLPLAHRDWVPLDWDGTGPVTVVVPGSTAHSEQYARLGAGLSDLGVYARVIDVRGHGRSVCASATDCSDRAYTPRVAVDDQAYFSGRLGDSADENQLVRDLNLHLADLRAGWPEASLHLVGHSSGGGLVSRLVENAGAGDLSSVALLAPYNHPDQPQVRPEMLLDCEDIAGTTYARVDLGAVGAALRGDVHRYVSTFHKGEAYTQPLDTLSYTWTTLSGMSARDPDGFWRAYTMPLLFVAADSDHVLDPAMSLEQAERAAGEVRFYLADDTSHVGLSWSEDVAAEIADWFLGAR